MHCYICNSPSHSVFTKKVLGKYDVSYFQCSNCGFIQTETPYWLEEAYSRAVTALDVYMISRTIAMSHMSENLILKYFDFDAKFLDYGGGYGIFTRIMRDKGINFYRQDLYAENIFAPFFDINTIAKDERKFELVTCFEVLEHLNNPIDEIRQMLSYSDSLFCSTKLQPNVPINELKSWDYLGELHGQHICFYTQKSMEIIADKFGLYYYNDNELHLFTRKKIENFKFMSLPFRVRNKLVGLINKSYHKCLKTRGNAEEISYLKTDYHFIKSCLFTTKKRNLSLLMCKLNEKFTNN